jgi:peptide/nickel transport system permease protein
MTIVGIAGVMRLTRSSMLEQLGSEYIKLARIKGVSERAIVWRHALRNSLSGVTAYLGVGFATLITGSILLETVFAWPGVGRLLYEGIVNRDYPVVQTVIVIKASFIVLVNLVADVLQAYVDPRIRLGAHR